MKIGPTYQQTSASLVPSGIVRGGLWLATALLLLLLASCKPSLPKGVLSESKMTDVLYDYHLAQSMPAQYVKEGGKEERQSGYVYMQAVFKKHGITEAEFDSSMVFYCGDLKRLHAIFDRVSRRLERDADVLGVSAGPRDVYAGLKAFGDTANVWSGRPLFAIKSNNRDNLQSWDVLCDSSWLAADDVLWRFNTLFLSKDGMFDLYAELIVTYRNDSIRSYTSHINRNGQSELRIQTDSAWVPRSIHGNLFMPLEQTRQMQQPTMRLCIVSDPLLIRFHDPNARSIVAKADTTAVADSTEVADSLSADSVQAPTERLTPEQRRNSQQSDHRINVVKKKAYKRPVSGGRRRRVQRR